MARQFQLTPDLQRIIDEVAEVALCLWQKGWAERNAGNISFNVTPWVDADIGDIEQAPFQEFGGIEPTLGGKSILVTGSGTRMRDLSRGPAEVLRIINFSSDCTGFRILWGERTGEAFRPTSEFASHLLIHNFLDRERKPQKVVLHTHPTEIISLTHAEELNREDRLNEIFWSMHPEVKIVIPEGAGLVRYRLPGSNELAEETIKVFQTRRVAIWEKHGVVSVGADAAEALDLIDTLNKAAQIYLACRSAGFEPEGLDDKQLKQLVDNFLRK